MPQVGRPLKFKSVKELQKKIEAYFDSCYEEQWFEEFRRDEETGKWIEEKTIDNEGKTKYVRKVFYVKKPVQIKDFKITDLAIFLNTSRETLLDYEDKDEFSDTIKQAKLKIESGYEQRLINRGNSGDIFALKNFNWKDKTEVDSNVNLKATVSPEDKEKADEAINSYLNDNSENTTRK